MMYDRPLSRPVRLTASGEVLGHSTKVSAITVTPTGGDVVVHFKNGAGGEVLWSIEADASSGSHSVCFGPYPIFFSNGVYAEIVQGGTFLEAISVAVVEPQSSGT